jgi:hypothetical protein
MLFFPSNFTGYEHALASCLKKQLTLTICVHLARKLNKNRFSKKLDYRVRLGLQLGLGFDLHGEKE